MAEDPIPQPPRIERCDIRVGRDSCLQQRLHGDAARVFAQLLLQHVARRPPRERLADRRIVAGMLARRDVEKRPARDGHRRAWRTEHEAIPGRGRDGTLEVELNPSAPSGGDLVGVEHDCPAGDLDGSRVQ